MVLLAALAGWALYRLATRSLRSVFTVIDCMFVVAVCAAAPVMSAEVAAFPLANVQTAVLSATVIGFAVALPVVASVPMAALMLGAYGWGMAAVVGWKNVPTSISLHYVSLAAVMGVLLRLTLLRVEAAAKRARDDYLAADDLRARVAAATRQYEVEQFALLHDTAASTLLLVADGTAIPPSKLAAQAQSALAVLDGHRSAPSGHLIDVVASVREIARGARTPVQFRGSSELWLDGEVCRAVQAAAREVLNNVDRHADATRVWVDFSDHRLAITDDGRGLGPHWRVGRGIFDSIVGRMNRVGGNAAIRSDPGGGTTVELVWPHTLHHTLAPDAVTDADRLVARVRRGYGLALVGWALLVTALSVPALGTNGHTMTQLALVLAAVMGCLAALPLLYGRFGALRWLGIGLLIGTAVLQPVLLPAEAVCTSAQWSLWVAGWGLPALLLGLRLAVAFSILAAFCAGACASTMIRASSDATVGELGLLYASLGVLLVATQFADRIFADAVAQTHARTQAHLDLLARQRAAAAAHGDFRRRIIEVRRRVEPLLEELSRGAPIDERLRRSARMESQRIRTFLDLRSPREHDLVRALRPAMDAAIQRNVDITVHVQSGVPDLDGAAIESLAAQIAGIVEKCTSTARVVLTCADEEVMVSVVCRGFIGDVCAGTTDGRLEVVKRDDTTWITIRRDIPPTSHDGSFDDACDATHFSSTNR
ncbi:sensor histidine kinase [Mycobacterium deserti]|uniref:Histidine kinase/HSP90-like ATPase domain-containing protein n=1 Tax=Mycobacterium deserti TaxID=2978347 RepID=A0ABT2M883_9MYCO|nr:ATP-binding protein [Mycobacterium deserti]MCT7657819.1 hypothetical protein [Mycobacterium deserti]